MIIDALLQLSAAQAVTASAVSTNTIDLGVARDIGQGEDLYAAFTVDVAPTAAGAATVQFQIITSAAADLSSPTVIGETDAIPITDLTIHRKPIVLPIPSAQLLAQPIGQRYFGVRYTVGTGPLTAGAFSCNIVDNDPGVGKNYPSGFSVA
ncbi:phage protein [Sulfurimicrobium lacus]|uniref:Phage protein n=1 Tax=Sulfurimicrobium lacus TaxID=2715678 RepID=A0A6F8VB35_9PROT|nr:hypothetical protein [Sulfurimicrobium lacus]BCB27053.1 phage protein [Sulfurimicrobium lacus]